MIIMLKKTIKNIINISLMLFYNSFCKLYILLFGRGDKRILKYNISICLIFKNESKFLKEWLDYHCSIGVDHFYLYDNNSDDNPLFILNDYIKRGIVSYISWPYNNSQFLAYKDCFEKTKDETNWLAFLDVDEFICPRYETNIKNWLNSYKKYPAITIQWLMFGTGGQIKHDYNKNVIEQYYSCWNDIYIHGKSIVNTRYEIANFDKWYLHHHTYVYYYFFGIKLKLPAVNQWKYICVIDYIWGGGKNKLEKSTIQINHYFTKAWDIYYGKMNKTDVLYSKNPKKDISYFYKYEEKSISRNHQINRFLIRMKIYQNTIHID